MLSLRGRIRKRNNVPAIYGTMVENLLAKRSAGKNKQKINK